MENTLKMEYLITQIQQQNRANSCLESYHNHLQQKIPFKPNWHELVEGLRKEEYSIFHEQAQKERKGEFFTGSSNFSKKFAPEWAENKLTQMISPFKPSDSHKTVKNIFGNCSKGKKK